MLPPKAGVTPNQAMPVRVAPVGDFITVFSAPQIWPFTKTVWFIRSSFEFSRLRCSDVDGTPSAAGASLLLISAFSGVGPSRCCMVGGAP